MGVCALAASENATPHRTTQHEKNTTKRFNLPTPATSLPQLVCRIREAMPFHRASAVSHEEMQRVKKHVFIKMREISLLIYLTSDRNRSIICD
jgi:hypothetical protein